MAKNEKKSRKKSRLFSCACCFTNRQPASPAGLPTPPLLPSLPPTTLSPFSSSVAAMIIRYRYNKAGTLSRSHFLRVPSRRKEQTVFRVASRRQYFRIERCVRLRPVTAQCLAPSFCCCCCSARCRSCLHSLFSWTLYEVRTRRAKCDEKKLFFATSFYKWNFASREETWKEFTFL